MAMASPTPMGGSHFGQLNRRPSRQALRQPPSRPHISRGPPLRPSAPALTTEQSRQYSLGDSSDDELPMPMKFSALTNALLAGEGSILQPDSPETSNKELEPASIGSIVRHVRVASAGRADVHLRERTGSPDPRAGSPLSRRIVRLSGTPHSSALRTAKSLSSVVRKYNEQAESRATSPAVSTPAPLTRTVRIPITSASIKHGLSGGSAGNHSARTNSVSRSGEDFALLEDPVTVSKDQAALHHGSVSRYGSSTLNRSRYAEETGMQSSMRSKRVAKVAGNFLSGPARRGRRRQSEEEHEPGEEREGSQAAGISSQEPENQESAEPELSSQESHLNRSSLYSSQSRAFPSGSPVSAAESIQPVRAESPLCAMEMLQPVQGPEQIRAVLSSKPRAQPVFRVPPPHPNLPSAHDQENEAPPTFKRNKPNSALLDKMEKVALRPQSQDLSVMRATTSPERQALAPRSQNTPRRPAPAPPKMSVLETATATAGAATTSHASKKRSAIRVNGKGFTRLEIIGRGGSSKVWRVMAENGKFLALKRVSLEDADESTVRGYKGEIDLLKKLEGNDRVVRMLDFEMNDEKQTLSVLMEMGELDFNKLLTLRLNTEFARFDPNFTRHYWKEMLECIEAVHQHDIVHSDLKPANFVLVQGRLKLIDFGIANAIQTDETVNVHRETNVGTPNYMSPESLMDANELPHNKGLVVSSGQPRIMKIGKPSDIWSLGCILYQMAYGKQPFAHIQNPMSRCRAITDFRYDIEFGSNGVGGVTLPKALIKTMRKCLERDQFKRPAAGELLSEQDPFLYPDQYSEQAFPMTEELLGRILQSVANKCREREPSEAELLSLWPAGYFASLRKSA